MSDNDKRILEGLNPFGRGPEIKPEEKKSKLLEDAFIPYGVPYAGGTFQSSNPYSRPFGGVPGNMVGPDNPIFGHQQPPRIPGLRYDPPGPFFMPPDPDHFAPPGPQGPDFRNFFDPRGPF